MTDFLKGRIEELAIEELRNIEVVEPLINPATIAEYLQENIERYTEPGLIVYEALLVVGREDAEYIADQMYQGADMWTLAQGYPRFHDSWRNYDVFHVHKDEEHTGGEMPEVMAAVRSGTIGDISGPYPVTFRPRKDLVWNGYVVIKILEKRSARKADLDDPYLQNEIRRLLRGRHSSEIETRFKKFIRELRQTYADQIEITVANP